MGVDWLAAAPASPLLLWYSSSVGVYYGTAIQLVTPQTTIANGLVPTKKLKELPFRENVAAESTADLPQRRNAESLSVRLVRLEMPWQ